MSELPAAIALAALLCCLLILWSARRRRRRRFSDGAAAERAALTLAQRSGYRVLATQVAGTAAIIVDGQRLESALRADMLLGRWGRRYLGEVKSGARAPDPTDRATRRQLLEYSQAFDVDGLLLFDMEKGRIRRIDFPRPARPRALWSLLLGLAMGYALGHHEMGLEWARRALGL